MLICEEFDDNDIFFGQSQPRITSSSVIEQPTNGISVKTSEAYEYAIPDSPAPDEDLEKLWEDNEP